MKKQQIVKVNETNSVSILEWENGTFEVAHLVNGEVSYKVRKDVETFKTEWQTERAVQDLVADILASELEELGYEVTPECDQQVIIEFFTYNVWVAVNYFEGELSYYCSALHTDKEYESDTNKADRKTWKGLMNYIKRFDK
jgi:hypothetical protein